jgi:hypothetical protein
MLSKLPATADVASPCSGNGRIPLGLDGDQAVGEASGQLGSSGRNSGEDDDSDGAKKHSNSRFIQETKATGISRWVGVWCEEKREVTVILRFLA